jgi:hypothetical protein
MKWKGFERKRLWPNFKYYSGINLEELRKSTNTLSQYSRSLPPDVNSRLSKYKAGVLSSSFPKAIICVSFVPFIIFLYAIFSFIPCHFLFINRTAHTFVFGQLSNICPSFIQTIPLLSFLEQNSTYSSQTHLYFVLCRILKKFLSHQQK